jgi:hypothetical protein
MDHAKHRYKIMADAYVLTHMSVCEETHHVMANRGVVVCVDAAEKAYRIVPYLPVEAYVAEKHNHVVIDFALDANAAKETNCVADGRIGRDVNVAEKCNGVVVIGVRSRRAGHEGRGGNQESGEDRPFPRH